MEALGVVLWVSITQKQANGNSPNYTSGTTTCRLVTLRLLRPSCTTIYCLTRKLQEMCAKPALHTRKPYRAAHHNPSASAMLGTRGQTVAHVHGAWVARTSRALETHPAWAVLHSLVLPLAAQPWPPAFATRGRAVLTVAHVRSAWVVRTSLAQETQAVWDVLHFLVLPQAAQPSRHVFATRVRLVLLVVRVCSPVLLIITYSIRSAHFAQQTPPRPLPARLSPPAFATPGGTVQTVAHVHSAWVARTSQALETQGARAVR